MSELNTPLKINYFPLTEVITFTLAITALIVFFLTSGISLWFSIPLIIFLYFTIVGKATIIRFNNDILKITAFNPFWPSTSIQIKSIIKISSVQELEHQTDAEFGGSVYTFSNKYEINYLDIKAKKRKAYFTIKSKNKEEKILRSLSVIAKADQ